MTDADTGSENHDPEEWRTGRSTAPQSPYGTREVAIGIAVLLVGLAVAIGVPVLATM